MTMKKIIKIFKFTPWKNILINIIGLLMFAIGFSIVYYHAISNEFLLCIISFTLIYYGSILFHKDVFHVTEAEKAMLAVAYFSAYWNYKKCGVKPDYQFTFEEPNTELKIIREHVDEVLSQEN